VTARRSSGGYRIYAEIISSKRANARILVERGSTILGERLVLVPRGHTTAWLQLGRRARPGLVWLVTRLHDADGQIATVSRRITLGH
jgi:hypothetical protein